MTGVRRPIFLANNETCYAEVAPNASDLLCCAGAPD
jgi:hypothetical protein